MSDIEKNIQEVEEETQTVTLEFEDGGEVECEIMGVFDVEGKDYIALLPDDDTDDVYLYAYEHVEDDTYEIVSIDDDALFEKVSAEFDRIMSEIENSSEE